MGNGVGGKLEKDQINQLREPDVSEFTEIQIKKIYKQFLALGRSNPGYLTQREMQMIPELSLNPMCRRVMDLLDHNAANQISFKDFIRTLWIFSPSASKELKIKTFYKVFDIDDDGRIDDIDLHVIVQVMVGKQYPSDKLLEIVKDIIQKAQIRDPNDPNQAQRDYLTFDELTKYLKPKEIIDAMTSSFIFTQ